jgi:glycine betaine/proline transport system ATP-binding protein
MQDVDVSKYFAIVSDSMIAVTNLSKVFGSGDHTTAIDLARTGATRAEVQSQTGCTVAVRDIEFAVSNAETFVVMGLSGSGKSTLIRCMSRLIEPTSGGIEVAGRDLLRMNPDELRELRRTRMSMVFQHFGLFPHRRVIDNVAFGLEVQGIKRAARHERAREVINVVGLAGCEDQYPQQLSGGMQQRVGLARALALDPDILFFDEPFSALDPLIRRDMQDELLRLRESLRCTIVFITHDFAEALRIGDRIAIMKDGTFDQIGTPEHIVTEPATDYVREFTRDVPAGSVVRIRSLVRPGDAGGCTTSIAADARVDSIIPILLEGVDRVAVHDDGVVLGTVDRRDVLQLLARDR